jgi:hypothetical protein
MFISYVLVHAYPKIFSGGKLSLDWGKGSNL